MKIGVYLGGSLPDPSSGGGFTFQSSLLDALMNVSGDYQFFVFYKGRSSGLVSTNPQVSFIPLHTYQSDKSDLIFKKILLKCARAFDAFVVKRNWKSFLNKAAHDYGIDVVWFMTPSYEFVDVPYFYTVWDLQHRRQSYFPEVSVTGSLFEEREALYKSVIPRAAYVFAGNEVGKQEVIKFYGLPVERVKTLELPTPTFVLDDSLSEEKYQCKEPYIFYPAQFWPHKNHLVILRALKILKDENSFPLTVLFSGSDKGNLKYIKEQVIELGLQDNVHFLGFVTTTELIKLYKGALSLVFASFFGPNNIPPLEAFALGCPVIAASAAGVREQLGDAALFFNPIDPQELALKIKSLHAEKSLRDILIARGRQRALSWTSQHYVQAVVKIINEFEPIRSCWSSKEKYVHL